MAALEDTLTEFKAYFEAFGEADADEICDPDCPAETHYVISSPDCLSHAADEAYAEATEANGDTHPCGHSYAYTGSDCEHNTPADTNTDGTPG